MSLGAGFPSMISLDMGEDPKGKRKMSMALRAGSSSSELGPGAGQREAVRGVLDQASGKQCGRPRPACSGVLSSAVP